MSFIIPPPAGVTFPSLIAADLTVMNAHTIWMILIRHSANTQDCYCYNTFSDMVR